MGIATFVEQSIQNGMDAAWGVLPAFMNAVGFVLGAAVGLYFVMVLWSYMWTGEASKLPIMDIIKRFFFLALMTTFALNADYYITAVKDPILAIPNEVGQIVSNNSLDNSSILDSMIEKNGKLITDAWEPVAKRGIMRLSLGLIGQALAITIVVGLMGTVFVVIAAAYLLVAKIMINVVLILGPAFIMFGFFPPTREYLMKWVGVVLNYVFLVVIYSVVFTLLHNVLTQIDFQGLTEQLTNAGAGGNVADAISAPSQMGSLALLLFFVYLLFIGVMFAVPAMASSLTGGVGISPFGQMAELVRGATPMGRGVAGIMKALGSKLGRNNSIGGGRVG